MEDAIAFSKLLNITLPKSLVIDIKKILQDHQKLSTGVMVDAIARRLMNYEGGEKLMCMLASFVEKGKERDFAFERAKEIGEKYQHIAKSEPVAACALVDLSNMPSLEVQNLAAMPISFRV